MTKGEKISKSILFIVFNVIDICIILLSVIIWISPIYTFNGFGIENPVFIAPYLVALYMAIIIGLVLLSKYFPMSKKNIKIPLIALVVFLIPILFIDTFLHMTILFTTVGGGVLILLIILTTVQDLIKVYKFNN